MIRFDAWRFLKNNTIFISRIDPLAMNPRRGFFSADNVTVFKEYYFDSPQDVILIQFRYIFSVNSQNWIKATFSRWLKVIFLRTIIIISEKIILIVYLSLVDQNGYLVRKLRHMQNLVGVGLFIDSLKLFDSCHVSESSTITPFLDNFVELSRY